MGVPAIPPVFSYASAAGHQRKGHIMQKSRNSDPSVNSRSYGVPGNRFDRNRTGYVDSDGSYVYLTSERRGGGFVEVILERILPIGKDGRDNREFIAILAEEDHEANLQERYESEIRDQDYEAYMARNERSAGYGDLEALNPVDIETYRRCFASESAESNELADRMHAFIRNLPEEQQNLIYDIGGNDRKMKDIAAEQGRYPQSVCRSYARVVKQIGKALKEGRI